MGALHPHRKACHQSASDPQSGTATGAGHLGQQAEARHGMKFYMRFGRPILEGLFLGQGIYLLSVANEYIPMGTVEAIVFTVFMLLMCFSVSHLIFMMTAAAFGIDAYNI